MYRPEINEPVEKSRLEYNPPKLQAIDPHVFDLSFGKPVEAEPKAESILKKMAATYAGCKSYQDTGERQTVKRLDPHRKYTVRMPFTTAFVRPDRFRFERKQRHGEEDWDRHLFWSNGIEHKSWWDVKPGVTRKKSFEELLYLPSFLASPVLEMLAPKKEGDAALLKYLKGPQRIEDADWEKNRCYRIRAETFARGKVLWIDQKNHLLVRIDAKLADDSLETTTYRPVLDAEVAQGKLVFDPPEKQ